MVQWFLLVFAVTMATLFLIGHFRYLAKTAECDHLRVDNNSLTVQLRFQNEEILKWKKEGEVAQARVTEALNNVKVIHKNTVKTVQEIAKTPISNCGQGVDLIVDLLKKQIGEIRGEKITFNGGADIGLRVCPEGGQRAGAGTLSQAPGDGTAAP